MELGRKVAVEKLAFAPDGRTLAASSALGLSLWRAVADGARAATVPGAFHFSPVRFTADGRWLFAGAGDLWRIDPADGTAAELPLWGGFSTSFDTPPAGPYVLAAQRLTTGGSERTRVVLWRADDLPAAGRVWEREFPGLSYLPVRFLGPDRFARVEHRGGARRGNYAVVHDAATGEATGAAVPLPVPYPYEWQAAPDGSRLAARGTVEIAVTRLDAPDAPPVRFRNDSRKHFTGIAFHPSGRFLAAVSNDNTVKLFDTASGELARTFDWQLEKAGRMRSIAFSPDGTLAAAGSDKGKVVIWDVDA